MSKYNWSDIFKSFEGSGLSQTQFCKEQNINAKYFNLKYSQHRSTSDTGPAFVKAEVNSLSRESALTIQVGRCTVVCPANMPVQSFVSLVHQLA